jgi:hypothetical protein
MSGHNALHDISNAIFEMLDPGDAGTIRPDRHSAVCPVVTTAPQTRTLAAPLRAGLIVTVVLKTDGGDLTLTVTNGYNADADTTIVFGDAGDFVTFLSVQVGSTYYWRVLSHEGTNLSTEDLSVDQLTVGTLTLGGTVSAVGDMTPGAGIEPVTNSICEHAVQKIGTLIKTTILIDLTGLNGGGTADDIIGKDGTAGSHLGQITAAVNGTIFAGEMKCLEAPATSNTDVNLNAATVATGAEDADVKALTGYAELLNAGAWSVNTFKGLTALPAANTYLYLSNGAATAGTFSAGIFEITLWGK